LARLPIRAALPLLEWLRPQIDAVDNQKVEGQVSRMAAPK
jgi:hypothetical protein